MQSIRRSSMCLSTVYRIGSDGSKQLLAEDVATVRYSEGKLVFSDIMGIQTETEGQIERIDLMDNYIYIS